MTKKQEKPPVFWKTTTGESVPLEELRALAPEDAARRILSLDLLFDPLEEEEQELEPVVFHEELEKYLKDAYGLRKKDPGPTLEFAASGRLGEASFWVFRTRSPQGDPDYALVIREGAFTELAARAADMGVPGGGGSVPRALSPSQAAAAEYLSLDF